MRASRCLSYDRPVVNGGTTRKVALFNSRQSSSCPLSIASASPNFRFRRKKRRLEWSSLLIIPIAQLWIDELLSLTRLSLFFLHPSI